MATDGDFPRIGQQGDAVKLFECARATAKYLCFTNTRCERCGHVLGSICPIKQYLGAPMAEGAPCSST